LADAVTPRPSVTVTLTAKAPKVPGVPAMTPVCALTTKPGGSPLTLQE
jgi:hypothetical protein